MEKEITFSINSEKLGCCWWCDEELGIGVFKLDEDEEEQFCSKGCAQKYDNVYSVKPKE